MSKLHITGCSMFYRTCNVMLSDELLMLIKVLGLYCSIIVILIYLFNNLEGFQGVLQNNNITKHLNCLLTCPDLSMYSSASGESEISSVPHQISSVPPFFLPWGILQWLYLSGNFILRIFSRLLRMSVHVLCLLMFLCGCWSQSQFLCLK